MGGGSLATSLVIHGALLAIGVGWIFHIVPEPSEAEVSFPTGRNPGPLDQTNARKQQKAMARPNLSRAAAANVTASVMLPPPEPDNGLSYLAGLGSMTRPGSRLIGCGFGPVFQPGPLSKDPTTLFDAGIATKRVAYVLDFSITMVGEKDELMRRELAKSLKALPATTRYSVICFSGPVWLPGDEVKGGTVKSRGKTYEWESKSMWEWTHRGPLMEAPWLEAKPSELKRTLSLVDDVKSIGGTDWEGPLAVAIAMEPPPEMIFFMTDGVMEQRDMMRLTRGIAAKAKARNVIINTVAMMEPGAEAPMADLAKRTGGKFTVVEKNGRIRKETK